MTTEAKVAEPAPGRDGWVSLTPEKAVRLLWHCRRTLAVFTLFFSGVGVVLAVLTAPEYVSEARIMPEMHPGAGDTFRKLASAAGFAGLNLSDIEEVEAVRPDLYPNILQSSPFILYLLERPVLTGAGTRKTVSEMLRAVSWKARFFPEAQLPLPPAADGAGPIKLTEDQQDLLEEAQKRISARMDTRSGVITIAARVPDAVAVASVAQLAMDYLTRYVTGYRTEKARKDLAFYGSRLNEARRRFQAAQYRVFQYNDQHKNMIVQAATLEKKRLDAELVIAESVYSELARQHEQARIKVQERTPVFKVLEPPKIPLKRESPKRMLMVLTYSFVGFVIGSIYLLITGPDVLGHLRRRIRFITQEGPERKD
ncbi:lipopolysaccharide biosynthesis protein [Larkinella soli]|uniref:lipopolysaccharide biosynthesis protein n=1 Tax=Larkinella soli TaxID=1770527 RepID=UPI0019D07EB0|nr:lipopolysaccharide biosynthesis protein [Larkinella soli]